MNCANSKRSGMVYVGHSSTKMCKMCSFELCFSSRSKFLFFDCCHSLIDSLANVFARERLVFSAHQKVTLQHESPGLIIQSCNPKGSNLLHNDEKAKSELHIRDCESEKILTSTPLPRKDSKWCVPATTPRR